MYLQRISFNCECHSLIIVFTASLNIDLYGQHGLTLQHKNMCGIITLASPWFFLIGSVGLCVGL